MPRARRALLALAAAVLCQLALAASPAVAATNLTVSTTADIATNAGACGNSSTTVPSPLSLREATCLANNIGGTVNITVPAGHYNLANGELQPGKNSGQTVNITGAGSASTIIDGQGLSRVIDYDVNVVGGVNASISGVTITGGHVTTIGSAGIIAGSGHATTEDVLTVDSVVFNDNHVVTTATNDPGGGLGFQGGKLSVSNSTFSNNSTGSSPGSGLFYQAYGNAPGESMSVDNTTVDSNQSNSTVANLHFGGALEITAPQTVPLSVTGSTFKNNTVTGTVGSASGAGIFVRNGTLTVTGSNFTGNSVTSSGAEAVGAALYVELGSATMHYNRIVGNSPGSTAVALATTSTPPVVIDATKNWWGCNAGPGHTGCDGAGTNVTFSPWLVLSGAASPSTVNGPNGTSTITAGFTKDSANGAVSSTLLGAFTGKSVTWSDPTPNPATINAASTTISSGTAQVTYNSQSAAGSGHVVGTFDNQSVTVPLTVNKAPAISSADHTTFTAGVAGSFTVSSNGTPTPTVSKTGALPSGVTLDDQGDGTALLHGTPSSGSAGSYPITVTASNSAGTATQSFTLTVQPGAVNDTATVSEDSGANTIDVLANDNASGAKAVTAKTDGTHGTVTITHSGADLTYTPAANYCGSDSFTYTLNGTSTATVSVTVGCVDDPTVAVDDSKTVAEDSGATTIDVRQNDTDIDSAKELIQSVATSAATHGTVTVTNSGADLTYGPAGDYCNSGAPTPASGDATFTYTLSGGSTATVSVTVTCVSDPPAISGGGTLNYTENDGPKTVSSGLSVTEPEGEMITGATASISTGYAAGEDALSWTDDLSDNITRDVSSTSQTLVLTGTGTAAQYQAALRQVSYTDSSDAPSTAARTVTYSATDASNTTGSGTATINVAAVNDAPAAADDGYATDEDTALSRNAAAGVLGNDTDVDNDPLTAKLVAGPAHAASFTLNSDGSFSYAPSADYHGGDSFTYKANDGTADSTTATVTLAVNSVNDAPAAADDSYATDEDTALSKAAATGVLGNDSDVDSDPLTAKLVAGPAHAASFTLNSDGSFDYTPNADYHGGDSFTYKANDGTTDSTTATVTLTINAVNDAPAAADDSYATDEDTALSKNGATGVLGNDSDVDSDPLTAKLVAGPAHATSFKLNADGSFDYTPNADYHGGDSFTYKANDGNADSGTATVTLTVNSVNDAPAAADDSYATDEDTALSKSAAAGVLGNDADADTDPLTAKLVAGPAHAASFKLNADGSFSYTPDPNYHGGDSFTYKANDGTTDSTTATVTLTVNPVNDAPAAADDSYATDEDTALSKDAATGVLGNDSDVDSDPLTAKLVAGPAHAASFTLNADGSFDYTPNADYHGGDSFTYKANDGNADSGTATVTLTVNSVNDAPAAADDSYATSEGAALTKDAAAGVLGNDTDADHDTLTAKLVAGPAHAASFGLNADGSFDYTPEANYHGDDAFTYKTNDGNVDSGTATVTLTVNAVDHAPVAVDDQAHLAEDAPATAIDVMGNDTDSDGGPKLISAVTQPAHGAAAVTSAGAGLTYRPSADYCNTPPGTKPDSFTYTLNGGSTATVSVTVDCSDDPPVAVDDEKTVAQGSAATVIQVLGNDRDRDGGPKHIVSLTQPKHGRVTPTAGGAALTYQPAEGYCTRPGAPRDTFTYKLNGGSEAEVAVTVTCAATPRPHPHSRVTVSIKHKNTRLVNGHVVLRLICGGPAKRRCAGILTLKATNRRSRLSSARAAHERFDIAVGHSQRVEITPPRRLLTILRRRGKAIGRATATLRTGGPSTTRLITVAPERNGK